MGPEKIAKTDSLQMGRERKSPRRDAPGPVGNKTTVPELTEKGWCLCRTISNALLMPKQRGHAATCFPLGQQMANARYGCLAGAEQCTSFWRNWRVGDGGEGGTACMFHNIQNSESFGKCTSAAPIRAAGHPVSWPGWESREQKSANLFSSLGRWLTP